MLWGIRLPVLQAGFNNKPSQEQVNALRHGVPAWPLCQQAVLAACGQELTQHSAASAGPEPS